MRSASAALLLAITPPAAAQQLPPAMGVRHALEAALVSAAPGRASTSPGESAVRTLDIDLYIFVSSHARESNFSGQIAVHFDRVSRDADDVHLVWRDQACHQRRGYPKVTPLSVEGRVGAATILARPRALGRALPPDELATAGIVLRDGDGLRQNVRWRFTTGSGLIFAMHVTTESCRIGVAEHAAALR